MQKGPYFQNVQYVSPLPEGYLSASSNIANIYGSAIANLGAQIGKGLEQYGKNVEQRKANETVFETEIRPAIESIANAAEVAKADPQSREARLAAYSADPAVQKLLADVPKFASMSTTQQSKLLDAARSTMNRIELSEQRDYTRGIEEENLMLRRAAFFNEAASTIERRDAQAAQAAADRARLGLEERRVKVAEAAQALEEKRAKLPTEKKPLSNVAQMMADRDIAIAQGRTNDATALQALIDAEREKAQQAGPGKNLQLADQTFIQNIKEYQEQLKQLKEIIKEYGTWEFSSNVGAAALGQLPYKMAITYAKIVDPQSVAREGEVEAARKYVIPTGLFTRNPTALAAIQSQEDELRRRAEEFSRVKNVPISNLLPDTDKKEGAKSNARNTSTSVDYVMRNGKLTRSQ